MVERTLHLVDEKQYKEIFVPSVAGDEDALNQLLEWASLLSAGWEPRSQAYALVKESRGQWKAAIEGRRLGDVAPRTQDFAARVLNVAYGSLSAYRRQAFVLPRGLSLSSLEPLGLKDLAAFLVDAGVLLDKIEVAPSWMRESAKALPGHGPSAGLYLPKSKAVAFLKALRADLRGHAKKFEASGIAPEPALALFLSMAIEAKETATGVLELEDALGGPRGVLFPQENVRSHALGNLPGAVLREVRKALGAPYEPPQPLPEPPTRPPPEPKIDYGPPVPYSPMADYRAGQKIEHKKFGLGEIKKVVDRHKLLVAFSNGERTLAQNALPRPVETADAAPQPGDPPVTDSSGEITPVALPPPS